MQEQDPDLNLFCYNTGSSFTGGFTVNMTVYQKGKKISGQTVYEMDYWKKCRHHGEIGTGQGSSISCDTDFAVLFDVTFLKNR
jgi:hypothetical protein